MFLYHKVTGRECRGVGPNFSTTLATKLFA